MIADWISRRIGVKAFVEKVGSAFLPIGLVFGACGIVFCREEYGEVGRHRSQNMDVSLSDSITSIVVTAGTNPSKSSALPFMAVREEMMLKHVSSLSPFRC